MITHAEAIAQCAEHIAAHDAHGYSQPNRAGWGEETLAFSDGTPYSISWGDFDCSEMVRSCVAAAQLVDHDYWASYMWTGNEDEVLRGAGFTTVPLADMRRGDVLWKPGHTGVYLGGGLMADAHGDEYGGIDGPNEGDQTGREIEIRSVWSCGWERCYRAPDGAIGVPAATKRDLRRGIDIYNGEGYEGFKGHETDAAFVICKASEGTSFVDPFAAQFAENVLAAGKLLGFYHFARSGHAEEEAEHFVRCCEATGHLGAATLWLDYEGDAVANGPAWAERFMRRVDELTGKTCGIYMSQSVTIGQDWTMSAHRPLWVAQYANMEPTGWQDDPWCTCMFGAWGNSCAIHQYSGNGHVGGWGGTLDLDRGYFAEQQWAAWATGSEVDPEPTPEPAPDPTPSEGEWDPMTPKQVTFATDVNVRTAPSVNADKAALYHAGETVTIDGLALGDGYVWGHYIGGESGADRYVALGTTDYVVQ